MTRARILHRPPSLSSGAQPMPGPNMAAMMPPMLAAPRRAAAPMHQMPAPPTPHLDVSLPPSDGKFEGADLTAADIAARELALGLPADVQRGPSRGPNVPTPTGRVNYFSRDEMNSANVAIPPIPIDVSALPDRFTLEVERKNGTWIVRAPAHHQSLFVSGPDIAAALAEAPGRLAHILSLDGPAPARRKRADVPIAKPPAPARDPFKDAPAVRATTTATRGKKR